MITANRESWCAHSWPGAQALMFPIKHNWWRTTPSLPVSLSGSNFYWNGMPLKRGEPKCTISLENDFKIKIKTTNQPKANQAMHEHSKGKSFKFENGRTTTQRTCSKQGKPKWTTCTERKGFTWLTRSLDGNNNHRWRSSLLLGRFESIDWSLSMWTGRAARMEWMVMDSARSTELAAEQWGWWRWGVQHATLVYSAHSPTHHPVPWSSSTRAFEFTLPPPPWDGCAHSLAPLETWSIQWR